MADINLDPVMDSLSQLASVVLQNRREKRYLENSFMSDMIRLNVADRNDTLATLTQKRANLAGALSEVHNDRNKQIVKSALVNLDDIMEIEQTKELFKTSASNAVAGVLKASKSAGFAGPNKGATNLIDIILNPQFDNLEQGIKQRIQYAQQGSVAMNLLQQLDVDKDNEILNIPAEFANTPVDELSKQMEEAIKISDYEQALTIGNAINQMKVAIPSAKAAAEVKAKKAEVAAKGSNLLGRARSFNFDLSKLDKRYSKEVGDIKLPDANAKRLIPEAARNLQVPIEAAVERMIEVGQFDLDDLSDELVKAPDGTLRPKYSKDIKGIVDYFSEVGMVEERLKQVDFIHGPGILGKWDSSEKRPTRKEQQHFLQMLKYWETLQDVINAGGAFAEDDDFSDLLD
ncbi:MAG: hypothetical protein KKH70_20800, partial [Gammaproteobacteria bacterium]|nr:hypothetical protein [Gammaproteobacteria bacterium]